MHVQLSLVCEDAGARPDGRVDVTGVFHDLAAPGFPAKQARMVFVTVIEWDRSDAGRHRFRVDLMTPDGLRALTVDGHSDVERVPGNRPPPRTRLILPLEEVIFPVPGAYRFEIRVKGRRFRGPSLFLIAADPATGSVQ